MKAFIKRALNVLSMTRGKTIERLYACTVYSMLFQNLLNI